ncbi:LutC/YkgG family protein [Phaeacidiphilus oryzae]|uniref:LutC/YkgG family protein n=1 Tax=Phaeacidiphilus oryzae TaxID=348818 RepID=UPI0005653776|nr:LUD domain-containing protein [Phaeacidiphilus oryzae]
MSSREQVLARIRTALADVPRESEAAPDPAAVPRGYRTTHTGEDPAAIRELLAENLADYRAIVHRVGDESEVAGAVGRLLAERGSKTVAVPDGLPADWLAEVAAGTERLAEGPELTARRLDSVDSVVTGCAVAIAETGTIVLDAAEGQGRRRLTLVPDHHICVIRPGQIVASVPQALPRLDPRRPQTWISGPSATSDIELDRVEGVHGPRTLEVVLIDD